MNISSARNGDTLTVKISGRLDTATAPQAENEFKQFLSLEVKHIILDFSELIYISSAGLRVLLALQKQMIGQGEVVLTGLTPEVQEIFEITGFSEILIIRP